jgi:fatty-acyl-CoA synthase
MLGLRVPYKFVAKMEVTKMPFIGTFLRQMGHLSFDRTDAGSRLRQAEEMEQILRRGESVFVFPEGTFTREEGLRPFQLGAFKAAVAAGAPIVPVSLVGTRKILREGTFLPRPGNIRIMVSAPIPTGGMSVEGDGKQLADWHELIRLRDETRAAIGRNLDEPVL